MYASNEGLLEELAGMIDFMILIADFSALGVKFSL